jgi:chlorite dismutase
MRTFVTAMVALGTIAFPATAQTPKPSVGSDQVYWVATFTVDQLDKFKPIVTRS